MKILVIALLLIGFLSPLEVTGGMEEYRINLVIPENCEVARNTLYLIQVDSCVQAKLSYTKYLLKENYVRPTLARYIIESCHREYLEH